MLDAVRELEKTLHVHSDDLPYVQLSPGTEVRLLMARPDEGIYAMQFRAQPFVRSPLHRHHNVVLGYTLSGLWGHDEQYLYRPGTMIYETPGVIHQFINGPEVTEAVFIGDPNLDFIDASTLEVTGHYNGVDTISGYIRLCRAAGVEPNFL